MNTRNRKLALLIIAGILAVWTFGLVSTCYAADTVTLELKDVDVTTAIESLFKGSGKNYVIEQGVYGRIPTLSIKDVEFDQALRLITRSNGLTFRIDQGTYMISPKPAVTNMGTGMMGSMTPGAMTPGAGMMNPQTAATTTTTKPSVLEKFQLMYSSASDIEDIIYGDSGSDDDYDDDDDSYNSSDDDNNDNNSRSSRSNRSSSSSRSSRSSSSSSRSSSRSSSSNW